MWKTIDICPSSIANDPQVIAACDAIDAELSAMYDCMASVPGGILFWPFTDVQDEKMTDVLAWEMHVDVWAGWDGDLSIEQKRDLINKSIDWHQHKGTKYAVQSMLETVFRTGHIEEWYQYGDDPYYFRVIIEEPIGSPERLARVYAGIIAVKNVRSWWRELVTPAHLSQAQMYVTIIIGQRLKNVFIPIAELRTPIPP